MIWLMLIVGAWCAVLLAACWATRRTRRLPTTPVQYWPAGTNPCTWCKPVPVEPCDCAGKCGHVNCVGDYTSLATLTAADMRLLQKWIKEGRQ